VINWQRYTSIPHYHEESLKYWVADGLHLITVIVFALAVQLNKDWLFCSLASIFVVAIIGHLSGVWVKPDKPRWAERLWLAGASGLGLVVIIFASILRIQDTWIPPIALAATLIAWYIVRYQIILE
jgi:hypothetical protein